jgi:hypothetical protein
VLDPLLVAAPAARDQRLDNRGALLDRECAKREIARLLVVVDKGGRGPLDVPHSNGPAERRDRVADSLRGGAEERLLGPEVVDQRLERDAGVRRDVTQCHLVVPAVHERVTRCVQDPLARQLNGRSPRRHSIGSGSTH